MRRISLVSVLVLSLTASCQPLPTCDGLSACAGIQGPYSRQCIDFCGPVWDFSASADPGQTCLVACAPGATTSDRHVCPIGSACEHSDARDGNQQWVGHCVSHWQALDSCAEMSDCGDGLACTGVAGAGGTIVHCPNVPVPTGATSVDPAVCWFPVHEGQACDSNAVDANRGGPRGCRPCEDGTWCVPISQLDPTRPTATNSICVRPCENQAHAADQGLCACGAAGGSFPDGGPPPGSGGASCMPALSPVLRTSAPHEQVANFFCSACLPDRRVGDCSATGIACCDGAATCLDGTLCCRQPAGEPLSDTGIACDPGSRNQQCCPGSFCNRNRHCEVCAAAGEQAGKRACCPGTHAVGEGADVVCAGCTDVREEVDLSNGDNTAAFCSTDSFLVANGTLPTPLVDAAYIPNHSVGYPLEYRGGLGASLRQTAGDTEQAQYSLSPTHHIFLFNNTSQNSDQQRFSAGTRFIELPPDDDGVELPATVPLPDPTWTDFRIFDLGACSADIPWGTLTGEFAQSVNVAIGGVDQLFAPVTTSGLSLTPDLRGAPFPPYGLLAPAQAVHYSTTVHAGFLGCPTGADITIAGNVSFGLAPGFNVDADTIASDDAVFAGVASGLCHATPDHTRMQCNLPLPPVNPAAPVGSPDRQWTHTLWDVPLARNFYAWAHRGDPDEIQKLIDAFSTVSCHVDRDTYVCTLPDFTEDLTCCPAPGVVNGCPAPATVQHCSTSSSCASPLVCVSGTCRASFSAPEDDCTNPARSRIRSALPPGGTSSYAHPMRPLFVSCFASTLGEGGSCGEGASTNDHDYAPALAFIGNVVLPHRPVEFVAGAYDLVAQLPHPTVSVGSPCEASGVVLQPIVNRVFDDQAHQINASIARLLPQFGRSARDNFHVPVELLLHCGSDAECQQHDVFGSYRSRCSTDGFCDIITLEPRVLHVMPESLQIVMAATTADPQVPLFSMPLIAGGGTLSLSCDPRRRYPMDRLHAREYSLASFIPPDITSSSNSTTINPFNAGDGTFCSGGGGSFCLCPQIGAICSNPNIFAAGLDIPLGTGLTCQRNQGELQCCTGAGATLLCAN